MTEETIRTRLQDMGVAGDAVRNHIMRARKLREMNQAVLWERVTDVGYRNEEGQVVVAKTDEYRRRDRATRLPDACSVCGHEYGTYGSEIPHRCCPTCQDGSPGLAV